MANRGRPINRTSRPRLERSRLLLVCEGEVTEVQYLQGLAQHLRATGASIRGVRPKGIGRDPLNVVKAALDMANSEDFDAVWAIVDVDEHKTLEPAIAQAIAAGLPVAVSNPCFEIWLLWHHEDCRGARTRGQLRRRLAALGHDGKSVPSTFPYEAYGEATSRSTHNSVPHSQVGKNPSSAMGLVVDAMSHPDT